MAAMLITGQSQRIAIQKYWMDVSGEKIALSIALTKLESLRDRPANDNTNVNRIYCMHVLYKK
jgi:hypothetical protein